MMCNGTTLHSCYFRIRSIYFSTQLFGLWGSSVGIVTDYGLDGPGIESRWDEIFRLSRPVLGPNQPPVQWVPGLYRGVNGGWGVLLTTNPLLVPRSWKSRATPLPTLWATTGPVMGTLYLTVRSLKEMQLGNLGFLECDALSLVIVS